MGSSVIHAPEYRRLCELLREWRTTAGLTQRAMAARLKRPHTFVHKCETGARRIDPLEFILWCVACEQEPAASLKQVQRELLPDTRRR